MSEKLTTVAKKMIENLEQKTNKPFAEWLETSGSFNSMVTHRVRLSSKTDVDHELIAWLKEAYEEA